MSRRAGPNRGGAFEKWTVRLLLPALLLVLVASLLLGFRDRPLVDWRAWFDGPERGTWRALTLNGEAVFDEKFLLTIADIEIVGGRDGCNYWSLAGIDEKTGERMITSTLAGCVDTPAMAVYRMLAFGGPAVELSASDRLVLTVGRCRGQFRRWTREHEDAERARYEAQMAVQREREQREAFSKARTERRTQPVTPTDGPPPPPAPPPPPPIPSAPVLPDC